MKIGVFATFMSPLATADMVRDFGRRAEAAGIDSIWMGEHVVLFDKMEFPYPGSKDGRIPVPEGGGMLDTVATFGLLAGATEKLRLGTGITLVPQRNPVYTAKEFATLDWLSGGRIDFGVGVGWCKEEVLACGYGWEDRGERCDEFLQTMINLWTQPLASFEGKHVQLAPCRLDPKPVQSPHIPILVGGHGARSLRRAAEFGSGWYGFALNPATTAKVLAQLDEALDRQGRSRDGFEIVVTPLSTTAEDLDAYRELGVDRLVCQLGSQKPERVAHRLEELSRLAEMAA
ncbi:MAG: LLM class F420-dependent oxidoreductase [Pseudomonadales bacterium]